MPETPKKRILEDLYKERINQGVDPNYPDQPMLNHGMNLHNPGILKSAYPVRSNNIDLDNSVIDRKPNIFQRFMGAINNPALLNSILGPNQMLQMQDQVIDPNLVLGRGPISKSYGASGNWTLGASPKEWIPKMHKLRERGID